MIKECSALAKIYTNMQIFHDAKEYEKMEYEMKKMLNIFNVEKSVLDVSSSIMRKMYVLSDMADEYLKKGDRKEHDNIFGKIHFLAKRLDNVLGLQNGSFSDEVNWWFSFRLARSEYNYKKPRGIKRWFNILLAFAFVFTEHFRRLEKKRYAFQCSVFLTKAGLSHAKNDWKNTERYMKHYWDNKIKGNNNKINVNLLEI